jgi:hypothetical protein
MGQIAEQKEDLSDARDAYNQGVSCVIIAVAHLHNSSVCS